MSNEELHKNNPLQGVGLKPMLEELVTYYGFDILYAYLSMNCFKANPSIAASAKFLKKTDWAREKVEAFYLYQYKNLPAVSSEQFTIAPRERIVPDHYKPGEPAKLSIEDGERLQQKRDRNAASRNNYNSDNRGSSRAHNNRRSSSPYRSNENSRSNKPSHYRKNDSQTNQSEDSATDDERIESTPTPPFNPWGNYKKKK